VYASDTNNDPRGMSVGDPSWDPSLPDGVVYTTTVQGGYNTRYLTSGNNWIWSVALSFTTPDQLSISLGVNPIPAPQAYIQIHAGSWTTGYQVKTVLYRDDSYLNSRSNRVPP